MSDREMKPSQIIDKFCDASVDMSERKKDIETLRLLNQLQHARIPLTVCDETHASISGLIDQNPWGMCDVFGNDVLLFIHDGKWATDGFRVLIEGGSEKQRKRMLHYCLYRGILAKFTSFAFLVKIYDWPTILPIIGDYRNPSRLTTSEGMRGAKILALTEIDVTVPMTMGGVDLVLTSILRGRTEVLKPTIITLKRPHSEKDLVRSGEIYELINTKHDVVENKVVRIRIAGDTQDEAHQ